MIPEKERERWSHSAWIVYQWAVADKFQTEIGYELGITSASICGCVVRFMDRWHPLKHDAARVTGYSSIERKKLAMEALAWYTCEGGERAEPPARFNDDLYSDYHDARKEYAFHLRCEGLTYKAIGERLGVSGSRANYMVGEFSRRRKRK